MKRCPYDTVSCKWLTTGGCSAPNEENCYTTGTPIPFISCAVDPPCDYRTVDGKCNFKGTCEHQRPLMRPQLIKL